METIQSPPPPYTVADTPQSDGELLLPPRPDLASPVSPISRHEYTLFSPGVTPSLQTSLIERPQRAFPDYTPSIASPEPWSADSVGSSYNLDLEKGGFVSARAYFELRSYVGPRPQDTLHHRLIIGQETRSEHLPYPLPNDKWSERVVDHYDWDSFLNHMFPKHSVESHALASHKQLKGVSDLPLQGLQIRYPRGEASDPSLGGYLTSVYGKSTDLYGDNWETERLRRLRLNAVTAEWNDGFFGPRGLKVMLDFDRSNSSPTVSTRPSLRSLRSPQSNPGTPDNPRPSSPPGLIPVTPDLIPAPTNLTSTSNSLTHITQHRTANVPQEAAPLLKREDTPLHQAVAKGSKSKVRDILKSGVVNLETPDLKGETALYRAVFRGDKSIVQLLLQQGSNPAARPPGCNSPLHLSVNRDRKAILEMLLERSAKEDIDEVTSTGETALYLAIQKKYASCARKLLEYGANPQARLVGQESMLNQTISSCQTSLVNLLLEYGADMEERNKEGDTPLCRSVEKRETKLVGVLLKHGATVSVYTAKGEAPLSVAVSRGDTAIAALLLAHKDIDVEVKNARGETPLYTAVTKGNSSITKLLLIKGANPTASPPGEENVLNTAVAKGNTALAHLLLESGVNLEVPNKAGETPLFKAVSRGDPSITSLLVGKGALVNTMNKDGETALYRAVSKGNTAIVSLLLCNGANTDTPGPNGETPLYRAVYKANTSIVSLLLCNDANPETPSPLGETPLYRAVTKNESAVVSLLLGRGANPDLPVGKNGQTPIMCATKKGNKAVLQLLYNYSPRKIG